MKLAILSIVLYILALTASATAQRYDWQQQQQVDQMRQQNAIQQQMLLEMQQQRMLQQQQQWQQQYMPPPCYQPAQPFNSFMRGFNAGRGR